jgi:large subunit ribosomal protein L15
LRGFKNPNKEIFTVVNVGVLADAYPAGSTVTVEDLRSKGLVRHRGQVKVLAEGELAHALSVEAHAVSKSAQAKIEAAGGSVEIVTE